MHWGEGGRCECTGGEGGRCDCVSALGEREGGVRYQVLK